MAPTSGPKPTKTSLALSDDGMSVGAMLTEEKEMLKKYKWNH